MASRLIQRSTTLETPGRGTLEVTGQVQRWVSEAGVACGLATVFVHHTSASLILCENADPEVRRDLERWLARAVPDGDALFRHVDEGPDDMPAHVRCALTQSSIGIPVEAGRLALGTWQGLYLYEHRHHAHRRRLSLTLIGE